MHQCNHRPERQTPFKTHGDINQDRDQREQHRQTTILTQLFADRRADKLNTTHLDSRIHLAQRIHHTRTHLRWITFLRLRQAHQDLACAAKVLDDGLVKAALTQRVTHGIELNRLWITNLDQHAAGEIHTEIEAAHQKERYRGQHQRDGEHARYFAPTHEINVLKSCKKSHVFSLSVSGRLKRELLDATTTVDRVHHHTRTHNRREHGGQNAQ